MMGMLKLWMLWRDYWQLLKQGYVPQASTQGSHRLGIYISLSLFFFLLEGAIGE